MVIARPGEGWGSISSSLIIYTKTLHMKNHNSKRNTPPIQKTKTQKELKSQLSKIQGEIEAMSIELVNRQRELKQKQNTAQFLIIEIQKLQNPPEPKVSEHARLRYLERVKGINFKEIDAEILSQDVRKMIDTLGGSGKFPNKNHVVVMKNNMVVSIATSNESNEKF